MLRLLARAIPLLAPLAIRYIRSRRNGTTAPGRQSNGR
jgi:hypothetical protein